MKIEGREVIGKQTEVSARTLLSVSAIVIVIQVYKISGNEWDFLGRKFPAEVVDQLVPLLLIFLLIGHMLHWYADHSSFRNWFKISEAPLKKLDDIGKINGTEPLVIGLERRLQSLRVLIIENFDNADLNYKELLNDTEVLKNSVSEIHAVLGTISAKHQEVTAPAFLLVYIWYLAVPLLAFVVAFSFVCT